MCFAVSFAVRFVTGGCRATIRDIRATGAEYLTVGQYLPPSKEHWKLDRYVTPEMFGEFGKYAREIGFTHVASGPLVRSSYYADQLADKGGIEVKSNQ